MFRKYMSKFQSIQTDAGGERRADMEYNELQTKRKMILSLLGTTVSRGLDEITTVASPPSRPHQLEESLACTSTYQYRPVHAEQLASLL